MCPYLDFTPFQLVLRIAALSNRRNEHDLTILYKIIKSNLLSEILLHVPFKITLLINLFHVPLHRMNYGANFFLTRVYLWLTENLNWVIDALLLMQFMEQIRNLQMNDQKI